jgi:hypothetical protein
MISDISLILAILSAAIALLGISRCVLGLKDKKKKKKKKKVKRQKKKSVIIKRYPLLKTFSFRLKRFKEDRRGLLNFSLTKAAKIGVAVPQYVGKDEEFTIHLTAYTEDFKQIVRDILYGLSSRSKVVLDIKEISLSKKTKVSVRLYGDQFTVIRPEQTFVWIGRYNIIDFTVKGGVGVTKEYQTFKFEITIDEVPICSFNFEVIVSLEPNYAIGGQHRFLLCEFPKNAFASYSSKDRSRVLDRISSIKIFTGTDIFVDCLSLHPSEKWKIKLEKEIIARELFLLFWSRNAKKSKYVTWEWKTALDNKGINAIQIQPLESEIEAPPPEELASLHFGDPCMILRTTYETARKHKC